MAPLFFTSLECSRCGKVHDPDKIQNTCLSCGGTLFARYDTERVKSSVSREQLARREDNLWRYREMLPVRNDENVITLGEGMTPVLKLSRSVQDIGISAVLLKDDGLNPTGSFKSRGMAVAISRARELGIKKVAVASAGNAGGAAAAYAAKAGLEAHIVLPKDAPSAMKRECALYGAHLQLVDGIIGDAARFVIQNKEAQGWFELNTLKEPYRLEGKKTMGYEVAEQFSWKLPDVIIYPTGGGTGLVGMWKAFKEMEALGWIGGERPRMVTVQSAGCAPVVEAMKNGKDAVDPFPNPHTIAAGLRVPSPYASEQIVRVLKESGGTAVAVSDEEILGSMRVIGKTEGISVCPEGAAPLAGLRHLRESGFVDRDETVLLYNTGSGLKYQDVPVV